MTTKERKKTPNKIKNVQLNTHYAQCHQVFWNLSSTIKSKCSTFLKTLAPSSPKMGKSETQLLNPNSVAAFSQSIYGFSFTFVRFFRIRYVWPLESMLALSESEVDFLSMVGGPGGLEHRSQWRVLATRFMQLFKKTPESMESFGNQIHAVKCWGSAVLGLAVWLKNWDHHCESFLTWCTTEADPGFLSGGPLEFWPQGRGALSPKFA